VDTNQQPKNGLFKLMVYSILIFFTFAMIVPVYILVKVSISEPEEVNTAHPTFLIHNATLEHWKNVLMTERKTEDGLVVYHVKQDQLKLQGTEGQALILTPEDDYTINGVFRQVQLVDGKDKSITVTREALQDLRAISDTSMTFWGSEVIRDLYSPLWKSISIASLTTILAIIIAAPASYVISLFPKSLQYTIILSLLFSRMFPDVGIALPIATRFLSWGLTDTTIGIVMAHLIPNLPFLAWILVGTFQGIPRDLEKSAMIDGASRLTALRKIIFPIAAPGIAVGSIFVWLNSWNEFIYARYLSSAASTLPIKTFEVITTGSIFSAAAYATILTIPVLIVTFLLQRYLQSGMLSGAVK
jgi:trehalose transport system permease protein